MEYRQSKTAGDIFGLIYASGFGIDLKESNYYYIEDARSYLLIDKVGKGIKEMEKFQIIFHLDLFFQPKYLLMLYDLIHHHIPYKQQLQLYQSMKTYQLLNQLLQQ